jgi:hypothetical protein
MEEVKELFQLAASASEDFTDGIDQAQQVLDEAHKPIPLPISQRGQSRLELDTLSRIC